jgi:predicted thioredoxin/glutaredoxin
MTDKKDDMVPGIMEYDPVGTPMDRINEARDDFVSKLYLLLDHFYVKTGCYIKEVKLKHQLHHEEYEKSYLESVSIGLVKEPFFTKEKENEDNA